MFFTAKKYIAIIMCASVVLPTDAQTLDGNNLLKEVVVSTRRPLSEIGVQKTSIDSVSLHDNISMSMADVLTYNSSVFVKNHGRATLSTVAFRGTSPSHTQVTWNGMLINSPMMGMTDFSTIPAFFIDKATLLHGTSSTVETGGGLGGLVSLSTAPEQSNGFHITYIQGIGSFSTFDEYLKLGYGNSHWNYSTRIAYSSSPNDYRYTNHDKKVNIYDDDMNIVGQYYPREKNKSSAYKDFHILNELYYNTNKGDRFGLNIWFSNSNRELPLTTTDYGNQRDFENKQRENTLRGILSWDHFSSSWKTSLKGGYINTWLGYDYRRELAADNWVTMTRSRSRVNTFYGSFKGELTPHQGLLLTASVSAHQNLVKSSDINIVQQSSGLALKGYEKGRTELSGALSAKWQPTERLGLSIITREEMFGNTFSPIIPAMFIDWLASKKGNVILKTSISRNYRFPTLNDLYFMPGGNPNLKNESGFTYDAGMSFNSAGYKHLSISGGISWFDSYIDNWIMWLPTPKGFFSPRNIRKVHSYGIETQGNISWKPTINWDLTIKGTYSWTPSINNGKPVSDNDMSLGQQLPYVPRHSASVIGYLSWETWQFTYQWAYYSRRYTMSSNEYTITGYLTPYFMNNISLSKSIPTKIIDANIKLQINNLFNEDYISVLSRPMPGINFEFFISLTPTW